MRLHPRPKFDPKEPPVEASPVVEQAEKEAEQEGHKEPPVEASPVVEVGGKPENDRVARLYVSRISQNVSGQVEVKFLGVPDDVIPDALAIDMGSADFELLLRIRDTEKSRLFVEGEEFYLQLVAILPQGEA